MPVDSPLSKKKAKDAAVYICVYIYVDHRHAKFTGLTIEFADNRKRGWPLPAGPRRISVEGSNRGVREESTGKS